MSFYLFILWIILCRTSLEKTVPPRGSRSNPFGDIRPGSRLTGARLMTRIANNTKSCAHQCTQHPYCISFNLCSKRICELNSHTVYSAVAHDNIILTQKKDCVYKGMQAQQLPHCFDGEQSVFKSVQDDYTPGLCKINTKRRDGIEVVELEVTDTSTEFKRVYRTKICYGPFHGGLPCPGGHQPLEWYKWTINSDKRTWWESVTACQNMGGKLLSHMNNTLDHIRYLVKKIRKTFWVGLSDRITDGQWLNMDGENVNNYIRLRYSYTGGNSRSGL
ncbi:uncharacterized protein LOC142349101 [Convolutriloba macropyga]|uniref:uncharacterized protein LOC142349101 n=1 Tax=Convolutriloba macropyga TaxID=536237 RepID=UPI003F525C9C